MNDQCHHHVVPIFPAHVTNWLSVIDGQCTHCDGLFCYWEAYGYGDIAAEPVPPTPDEVWERFDDWWYLHFTRR